MECIPNCRRISKYSQDKGGVISRYSAVMRSLMLKNITDRLLGHLLCDRIVSPADQIRSLSNRGTQRSGVPEFLPTGFSSATARLLPRACYRAPATARLQGVDHLAGGTERQARNGYGGRGSAWDWTEKICKANDVSTISGSYANSPRSSQVRRLESVRKSALDTLFVFPILEILHGCAAGRYMNSSSREPLFVTVNNRC